jgi:hypothetical protein
MRETTRGGVTPMNPMLLMALALAGQTQAHAPARPRVIVSTPAPAERRPRVDWGLTTFGRPARFDPTAQAAEPPPTILEAAEAPFALDTPPAPGPSPQAATPQAAASCPCLTQGVGFAAPPASYAAPQGFRERVVSVTYGQPFIVSDSRQFTTTYQQPPITYAAPPPSPYPLTSPYPNPQAYSSPSPYPGAAGQTYADGSTPTGQAGASIYIDAHSTLEHGPRFGIGNGLFRSGRTERVGNSRGGGRGLFGGGGLFGRRGGMQGTSYQAGGYSSGYSTGYSTGTTFSAPMVCGPNGCSY